MKNAMGIIPRYGSGIASARSVHACLRPRKNTNGHAKLEGRGSKAAPVDDGGQNSRHRRHRLLVEYVTYLMNQGAWRKWLLEEKQGSIQKSMANYGVRVA